MKTRINTVLVASCLLLSSGMPGAQEKKSATLEKIRNYGAIYIGQREAFIPFSYEDADGKVIGYSMDLCGHIIDAVKARLKSPGLEVVPVPTAPGTRQMMLEAGTTDLQCALATNTLQRQRYQAFSVTTFVSGIKALVRRDSGIRTISEMKGKVVVTTVGTTSEAHVKTVARRQDLSLNYRSGRDDEDSLRQVLTGQADVLVLDDVLLHGLLMNMPAVEAEKLAVLEENFAAEPYGIMLRRNDPEFKKLLDDTLIGLMQSGEFARIYDKWFMSPIPPKGRNLNLPMSDLLKQLIVTPNDSGV